jgi:hypothetical protein
MLSRRLIVAIITAGSRRNTVRCDAEPLIDLQRYHPRAHQAFRAQVQEIFMNSPPNNPATEPRIVVPAQEARQGVTGQNVRYVLGWGLAAVIVAFGIIYFIYFH